MYNLHRSYIRSQRLSNTLDLSAYLLIHLSSLLFIFKLLLF
nr:MAG TPA: hypothetical protein [Caudoviricetes sp.]